jgi:glutamine synthetase
MDCNYKTSRRVDFNLKPKNPDTTVLEYIWLGVLSPDMKSKTMILDKKITRLDELPLWAYDASSTTRGPTVGGEVLLKPVFWCLDPFRMKSIPNSYLVLCEAVEMDGKTPGVSNFRNVTAKIMSEAQEQKPWLGFEQEYILMDHAGTSGQWPLGFPKNGYAKPQSAAGYYCSVGASTAIARAISECHMNACLAAGIQISGVNAEVFPGQWEYQLAPIEGIQACDELWMSRYILRRVCEDFDLDVTFDPKPVTIGDWNGSGCHANFSTEDTRNENGYEKIIEYMERLSLKQSEFVKICGEKNEARLSGKNETSSTEKFSYGIANRGVSVRIPVTTVRDRQGYFEDRRPGGNVDPYLIGGMLVDTSCLEGKNGMELIAAYDKCKSSQV